MFVLFKGSSAPEETLTIKEVMLINMARYSPESLEKKRKGNEERFLRAAKAKFGDKYDYSLVNYQQQKAHVTIICPKHGSFEQTPDKHLQSETGCTKCGIDRRSNLKKDQGREDFFLSLQNKYGDRLKVVSEYTNCKDSIRCICLVHKIEFESTPDRLLTWKHGCPQCAKDARAQALSITADKFIARASEQFGSQFDLSRCSFVDMNSPVLIGCPIHGEFKTTPYNFLQSTHGCPMCGRLYVGHTQNRIQRLEQGLTKSRPTTIAVMKVEVFGITGYKVGTTARSLLTRYRETLREILFEATMDELDALRLEQAIHAKYFRHRDVRIFLAGLRARKRWPGDSEIYESSCIQAIIEELKSTIDLIAQGSADYWSKQPKLSPPKLQIRKVRKVPGTYTLPKPVIRLDTLEVFDSVTAAAAAISSTQGNISMVCRGAREHAKGIRFSYLSDYEAGKLSQYLSHTGSSSPQARKVRCIETGEVYATVTEAAKATGALDGKISSVCKGKRKSAGDYKWEYVV